MNATTEVTPEPEVIGSGLTRRIFIGMILGVVCGGAISVLARLPGTSGIGGALMEYGANGLFYVVGQVFLRLLQVLVAPLVLVSLIAGIAGLGDVRQLGRIGLKTLGLYLCTTALAVSLAVFVAVTVRPGAGVTLDQTADFQPQQGQSVADTIIALVPRNFFAALAAGEMVPVIVFAILFGIGLTLIGAAGQRLRGVVEDISAVMFRLIGMVMSLAPFGVFALIARTFAREGFGALLPLLKFVLVTLATLAVFAFVVYPTMLKLLSGLSPMPMLRKIREVQLFAFSTASSNACIPLSLRTMQRLGIDRSVASFSATVGSTLSMDGTAIMQGLATVFIAQIYGVDLGAGELATIILTATLATLGTGGVPGAGIVVLSTVLLQVGLPVEGIALILGVDRILDMARTAVNVSNDFVIACIVAKSERRFDAGVYYSDERSA